MQVDENNVLEQIGQEIPVDTTLEVPASADGSIQKIPLEQSPPQQFKKNLQIEIQTDQSETETTYTLAL